MIEFLNPATVGAPAAAYSLGAKVPAGYEYVVTSGIVATRADGTIAPDLAEQAAEIWRSIRAVLAAGNCSMSDIVGYTTYVVDRPDLTVDLAAVMAARDAALNGHRATSTLLVVPRLARAEWQMEIAVVAARLPLPA